MSDVSTVKRLAALSRIRIPEDREALLASEFESVVSYISQLDSLSVSKSSTPRLPRLNTVLRPDAAPNEPHSWTDRIVAQFPEREGDSLKVKKILSND